MRLVSGFACSPPRPPGACPSGGVREEGPRGMNDSESSDILDDAIKVGVGMYVMDELFGGDY